MDIRHARPSELERVVAIYNQAIAEGASTADRHPVDAGRRRAWFHERDPGRRPLWVAELDGRVVGWLALDDFRGRTATWATAEIGACVDASARGAGVGSALLEHCLERAPALGIETLLSFVFAANPVPIAVCERHGFAHWGRLPGVARLDDADTDIVILGRRVAGASRSRSDRPGTASARSR